MARRIVLLVLAVLLAAGFPAPDAAASRAGPEPRPDLAILPYDILFIDDAGTPVNDTMPGRILFINVTVHNAGGAESGPFNVSFFENGALLETVPVSGTVAPGRSAPVSLVWDTVYSFVGLCTIAVELECPAGDANPANNTASRTIRIHPAAPVLNVTMDRPMVEVEAAGGVGQMLRLSGRVDVRMPFNQTAVVQLRPSITGGWACAVQPASLGFDHEGPRSFTATVMVPPDAVGGFSANLTIGATAFSGGYACPAEAAARLTVKVVRSISIECERNYQEIRPGQTARFKMLVTNTGNAVTDLDLSINNLEILAEQGWTIRLGRSNLTGVRPGETRTVNITAQSSDEFSIWHSVPSAIVFRARSSAPGNLTPEASVMYPVYAYEKGASTWGQVALVLLAPVLIGLQLWAFYLILKGPGNWARTPKGPS